MSVTFRTCEISNQVSVPKISDDISYMFREFWQVCFFLGRDGSYWRDGYLAVLSLQESETAPPMLTKARFKTRPSQILL